MLVQVFYVLIALLVTPPQKSTIPSQENKYQIERFYIKQEIPKDAIGMDNWNKLVKMATSITDDIVKTIYFKIN